jgi:hypothetical protein
MVGALLMASEPARLDLDTYTSVNSKLCRWWAKRVGMPRVCFIWVERGPAETSQADMARLPMLHSPKAGHSRKFGTCVYVAPGPAVNLRIVWISLSW